MGTNDIQHLYTRSPLAPWRSIGLLASAHIDLALASPADWLAHKSSAQGARVVRFSLSEEV